MKKLLLSACLLFSLLAFTQQAYWQQNVAYTIDVALDDGSHTLKGYLQLDYTNNSPDQLSFIWFHLWPNAYKNDNTAFAKQLFSEGDGRKRWRKMKDKGYMDSLSFKVDGQTATTESHPEYIDVLKLLLPKPIRPREKIKIETPFFVKLPTYNSRSGHNGQSYIVCQWYPKPAVYDRKGWHAMPYLDQGEFYSETGSFTVNITLPSKYVVGATGTLNNKEELETYKKLGAANRSTPANTKYTNNDGVKTLSYSGENIPDFAWFADKDFIIEYDTVQLASGKTVDVFGYHHPDGNKHWEKSTSYIKDAVLRYSDWLGEYPYPVVAAVEGPKNDMSGGMEYPMITLITSPDANEERLDAVIAHEVGHNWFSIILGSNERDHAWMDEGINSYFQFRYEAEKYKANSIFGDKIPDEVKRKPVDEFLDMVYFALNKIPMKERIEKPSTAFKNKDEYALAQYLKTAIWMYTIELSIGREELSKGMRAYFNEWKFKHPYPEDLRATLEKATNKNLENLFLLLNKEENL